MSSIYRSCSPRRVAAPVLVARTLVARVVYLHLLVGELAGQVPGIVRAGAGAIAEEVGLDVGDVRAALAELEQFGLAEVDQVARLIRLPGVAEDAARLAATPTVVVGWARVLAELPECAVRARHAATLRGLAREDQRGLFEPMAMGPDTLSRGSRDPSETLPRQDTDSSRTQTAGEQEQPRAEPLALTIGPNRPQSATPKRARRPDPSASPDVAAVWSEFQRLRVDLGLLKAGTVRREPAVEQARLLSAGLQRAGGVEQLLTVIRRQAESLRRQAEREGVAAHECGGAEFYDLSTICTAKRITKMLDAPYLDERRQAAPARASPRPQRPAPPQNPGSMPPVVPSDFGDDEGDETT